jgi:adenine-specific DNA-methyltransferase
MTTDAFAKLQELLRQLFQFDSKDLDFGIYRIMNHKRAAIEDFIQHGLVEAVDEALRGGAVARQAAQADEVRRKTDQVKETFGEYAVDSKGELKEPFRETPLGREYLEARYAAGEPVDLEELKATIFNHVYTFFSRYYDNGDFLSRRRYSKRQKYAIPYNGEEVYLHWANADQYYIKTGEHFFDYSYKARGGVTVRFRVAAAEVEHDNVKGEKRFFVPRLGDAAFDEGARTLSILFEWRPLSAGEQESYGKKQEDVNKRAAGDIPARFEDEPDAAGALEAEGLERHLRRYTRRNTSDFFIHKDLKGFLERELDFYLKNEVLDVDDLESWGPERSGSWFEVMRTVRLIGREVVAFLAQIEDFQKKLFEKKFVVSAEYCITLDCVPEDLYPEIVASDAQRAEWVRLFAIDEIEENPTSPGYTEPLAVDFLKANPHLVLDTKFFGEGFKDRLLASIEDMYAQLDGLLIESENFQALNLLQERCREQVKCIYIDPPYNTGGDGFLYKDSYQHSSWMTMMENRLRLAKSILADTGVLLASIDEHEVQTLHMLLSTTFGSENMLPSFIWKRKAGGADDSGHIALEHEHVLAASSDYETARIGDIAHESAAMTAKYNKVENGRRYYLERLDKTSLTYNASMDYAIEAPDGTLVSPPQPNPQRPSTIWRWGKDTIARRRDELIFQRDKKTNEWRIYTKTWESLEGVTPRSLLVEKEHGRNRDGTQELGNILQARAFRNPKPLRLLKHLLTIGAFEESAEVMDFFAGSGTTGQAVIDLNREDGGDRKYILVEMGEYFDTVLKPRILKVIYSKDWKDGKPVSREGTSHALKYVTLESYEDTLNNIAFTNGAEGQKAMELYGDDYLLRYMLDFETRDSETLLNVKKMAAPFDYRLTVRQNGEARELPVDLPETFAYLLGMRVRIRRAYSDGGRRYLLYRGPTREREDVAVIWRDTGAWSREDYERDRAFVEQREMAEGAQDVFVNGDSLIPEARPLEATFKRLMLPESTGG